MSDKVRTIGLVGLVEQYKGPSARSEVLQEISNLSGITVERLDRIDRRQVPSRWREEEEILRVLKEDLRLPSWIVHTVKRRFSQFPACLHRGRVSSQAFGRYMSIVRCEHCGLVLNHFIHYDEE